VSGQQQAPAHFTPGKEPLPILQEADQMLHPTVLKTGPCQNVMENKLFYITSTVTRNVSYKWTKVKFNFFLSSWFRAS